MPKTRQHKFVYTNNQTRTQKQAKTDTQKHQDLPTLLACDKPAEKKMPKVQEKAQQIFMKGKLTALSTSERYCLAAETRLMTFRKDCRC